ncbi:hypothetical protein EAH_00063640, partial [Eimeria acervulina]
RMNYFVDLQEVQQQAKEISNKKAAAREAETTKDKDNDKDKDEEEVLLIVVAEGEVAAVSLQPHCMQSPVLLITDLDGTLLGSDFYLNLFKKHWALHHLWRGSKLRGGLSIPGRALA